MFVANTFPAGAVAVKSGPGNNCPCFLLFHWCKAGVDDDISTSWTHKV